MQNPDKSQFFHKRNSSTNLTSKRGSIIGKLSKEDQVRLAGMSRLGL